VGAVVGIALLTVLAHPAGASALPERPSSPPTQSVSGSAPLAGVDGSTASQVPVTEAAISDLSSVASTAIHQIPATANPVVRTVASPLVIDSGALALPSMGAVSVTLPTTGPAATHGSGGSGSAVGAHVGHAEAVVTGRSGVDTATAGPRAPVRLGIPMVPSPVPASPSRAPSSPLVMSDASSYSSPVPGSNPLGLLPPQSLLLAALAVVGVLMARDKKLALLLDLRSSPPG
jgi:hypothetical protein